MSDTYRPALRHRNAEQIGEHDNIDTISTRSQRFHPQHINEISDYHLRRTVRKLFTGRGQPHLHQILQLHPRERTEISQRKTVDMLAKQDDEQDNHRNAPAESRGNGSSLYSQLRETEPSENQRIITYDIKDIHNHRHHHRIYRLVCATQGCGKSQRQRLKKGECPYDTHIIHTILHQLGPESHQT